VKNGSLSLLKKAAEDALKKGSTSEPAGKPVN
jgi:hypothetical protein